MKISKVFSLFLFVLALSGCTVPAFQNYLGVNECGPIYGNWCGKDYPREGSVPPTVDVWDSFCKEHDYCYKDAKGNASDINECDKKLVNNIESEWKKQKSMPYVMESVVSFFKSGNSRFEARLLDTDSSVRLN